MVEIARGRPAADEEHHREGDRQQAQDVGHLEEQGPQGQRFSEGPDDRRQPLVRQVHRHQWSEQPAKELAEQPVEDPAGDPLGDRGQREDVAHLAQVDAAGDRDPGPDRPDQLVDAQPGQFPDAQATVGPDRTRAR